MPFLSHAAGISRSQGDHFKTEGHFKNSQREFISSRLCRLLAAARAHQRLPPRGSWILRSKRLKEIALVKTLHKFHLYALSLSLASARQLPPGRSLRTCRFATSRKEPKNAETALRSFSTFHFQFSTWRREQGLAAARAHSGSDSPPDCHSIPSCRFATPPYTFKLPLDLTCDLC